MRKIWVTPTAVASGDGYQTKNTNPITNKAMKNEINKWLKKKFKRFIISILKLETAYYLISSVVI